MRRPPLDRRRSWPAPRERWHLALLLAAFTALAVTHSFLRHRAYESKGYDLGIFDQAIRQYALLKPPIVPVKGVGFHLLGDHFHPVLALLAPAYWIWDDPRVLGIVMALALALAAVPVYLFARRRSGHGLALGAAAALLLSWPFQAMVNWDFHEITLGVPLMAWLVWSLDGGRPWAVTALAASLLTVREDMGVTLVAVALVLAIRGHRVQAAVTAVLGVAGYWFATSVAIPRFSPTGSFGYWQFTALGPDLPSSLLFILTRPLSAVGVLVDHPLKIALLLLHLVPLLLLPLLSPLTLLAMPVLLSRLFNDRLTVWSPVFQYDAILAPILLMAALEAAHRLAARREELRRLPTVLVAAALGVSLLGTAVFPLVFPFHRTLTGDMAVTEHARSLDRAVSLIPDGVCVEAPDHVIPHLTTRTYVGLAGDIGDELATWTIVDLQEEEPGGWDPLTPGQVLERARALGFQRVWSEDGVIVLHHPGRAVDPTCSDYLRR